jgi:hypothetical protein
MHNKNIVSIIFFTIFSLILFIACWNEPDPPPCVIPYFSFAAPEEIILWIEENRSLVHAPIEKNPVPLLQDFDVTHKVSTVFALIHQREIIIDDSSVDKSKVEFYKKKPGSLSEFEFITENETPFHFRSACQADLYNNDNIGVIASAWGGFFVYGEIESDPDNLFPTLQNIKYGIEIGLNSKDEELIKAAAPFYVDIDHNDICELYIGSEEGNLYCYKNNGTRDNPDFSKLENLPFELNMEESWEFTMPYFFDVSGDDDYDLFIGEKSGNIYYFENTGTPENPQFSTYETNPFNLQKVPGNSAIYLFDIDKDCYPDAFVGYLSDSDNQQSGVLYFKNIYSSGG